MIYKALIKYDYSNFKLDILEYCTSSILMSREQYYLNSLDPAYNILKYAGSVKGFKHNKVSIEAIRASKLGRNRSEEDKLKTAVGNTQSYPVKVTDELLVSYGSEPVFRYVIS